MEGAPLDSFVGLCRPFDLPAALDFVRADQEAFLTPSDPAAALANLRDRHSDQELVDARLVQRNDSGQLQLHRCLAEPNAPFVALRSVIGDQTTDLMTASGCIGRQPWPLFAVMR